jgi:PAS domain-containing protein
MDVTSTADASLRRADDYVPQGLAVFDADLRLVASNARYRELLDLPARLVEVGTALYDIALYVGRRGDFGDGDPVQLAAARVETLTGTPSTVTQRIGKQGQTL